MRISDWSSDVCSSDLRQRKRGVQPVVRGGTEHEGERALPRHFTAPQAGQAGSFGSDSVFTRIVSASNSARRPAASSPKRTSSRNARSEEHTSELQSLMRISYAVFCLKKKKTNNRTTETQTTRTNVPHTEI